MVIAQRRRSFVGPLIALIVVAALVVVAIALFTDDGSSSANKDVSIQACTADPGGGQPTARGQIVNHSSKTSNYVIRLKFTDAPGNEVSEGASAVKNVAPNETATWELTGARDARGPLNCEVSGVTRTHIPGQ
jgi:hypothetical protein